MRGHTARKLRKIVKELGLPDKTTYAIVKGLHSPGYRDDSGVWHQGPERTQMMTGCFRRAYKEAKKVYRGKSICAYVTHGTEPAQSSFAQQVVDSVRSYAQG